MPLLTPSEPGCVLPPSEPRAARAVAPAVAPAGAAPLALAPSVEPALVPAVAPVSEPTGIAPPPAKEMEHVRFVPPDVDDRDLIDGDVDDEFVCGTRAARQRHVVESDSEGEQDVEVGGGRVRDAWAPLDEMRQELLRLIDEDDDWYDDWELFDDLD